MTSEKLEKYCIYKRRAEKLSRDIAMLESRDINIVAGKVKGSMKQFPFTERRFDVLVEEPEEADKINERITKLELEQKRIAVYMREIEEYIENIEDIEIKTIAEYVYLDGCKQCDVADKLGYSKRSIARRLRSMKEELNIKE